MALSHRFAERLQNVSYEVDAEELDIDYFVGVPVSDPMSFREVSILIMFFFLVESILGIIFMLSESSLVFDNVMAAWLCPC
jgi:hypothetical protein